MERWNWWSLILKREICMTGECMCVYRDGLFKRGAEQQELNLQYLIQDSTEHKLERLMMSRNFKSKMTPLYAQNFFSLAHLRSSKRLHKSYYKNEGFEQNVTNCCMLSWKQEWMDHTDKCCTCSWLKWSSSRRKQSTGATKELKCAVLSQNHCWVSFIHWWEKNLQRAFL